MADRILIQCPGCSAKLAISDESKLGKKIRCSKCSEVFVANALKARSGSTTSAPTKAAKPKPKKSDEDEFNFDDMEMEDQSESEEEESEEASRPARAKVGTKKGGKANGKGKKKSSGGNLPLIIGGSVAVVLLLGIGGYFLFRGGDPAPAPAPVAQQPAVIAPVVQADSSNDKILALKWLPQETELIIHLKIADAWQAPLLKGLLSGPQAAQGVAQMQQLTGLAPTDLESVTVGQINLVGSTPVLMPVALPSSGVLPKYNFLIVVRSKKPVDVQQLTSQLVQSQPSQVKVADHNGKSYIEGSGPYPDQPFGAWFVDANTLIGGSTPELFAAMDRGETVTPRAEFRAVDASPHLLFVVAPKDATSMLTEMLQTAPPPTPDTPPAVTAMQQAIQSSMTAVTVGLSVKGGVDLQSSIVFKDEASASKVKPGVEAIVAAVRPRLASLQSTTPPLVFELGEMLLNNIQVSEQSQVAKIATSIPDSAQQKLEQLPAVAMGMAMTGGMPFSAAPKAAAESTAKNNLKMILLAFHNYHDTHQTFPPAYNLGSDGKGLLSWRVHILPFIEQAELHKQFHLNEPWDSDHNKKLIPLMPATYASSDDAELKSQGRTRYVIPFGSGLAFEGEDGIKIADFLDGTSNTIVVVEVTSDPFASVVWTQPSELVVDLNEPFRSLAGSRGDHFLAGMADGSVRAIKNSVLAETLKALFTRKGGEVIPPAALQ